MPVSFVINYGDIIQVTFRQDYQGSTILNVLHYYAFGPSPGGQIENGTAELTNLLTTLMVGATSLGQSIRDVQVDTLEWKNPQAQVVYPQRRPYVRINNSAFGFRDVEGMPSNVDAVITKRGNVAGRGRAGSLHIAGVPRDQVVGAALDAAYITAMAPIRDKLIAIQPALEAGWSFIPIISWDLPDGTKFNQLGTSTIQDTVRVMRRRTLRIGV